MNYEPQSEIRSQVRKLLNSYFLDPKTQEGIIATDFQCDIFDLITDPNIKRAQIMTTTQAGKSLFTGFGAIHLARSNPGIKIPILAPTESQARIIMNYIIEHLFDHPAFLEGIIDVTGIEKLKTERRRDTVTWKDGSSIKVLTVSADRISGVQGKSIMGFGGDVIIGDECGLTPNDHWSKVLRMLGGDVRNSKLIKIGNPFLMYDERSKKKHHFYKSANNPKYTILKIDYKQAIKEGRLTKEYVEEMREEMNPMDFKVLYEVEFPDNLNENSVIGERELKKGESTALELKKADRFAGLDVSGEGKDQTVLTLLDGDKTRLQLVDQEAINELGDLQKKADKIHQILIDEKVRAIGIDVVGIGKGLADILSNKQGRTYEVIHYIAGSKAKDIVYYNLKSELIMTLRTLMDKELFDMRLMNGDLRMDLIGYKQKRMSDRKIKTEDPDQSPDWGDSLIAGLYAWIKTTTTIKVSVGFV